MAYKNPSGNLTKPHNGFMLIELFVVIGIAAILVSIAAPNFSQMVRQKRLEMMANDFKSVVALTRSEARKQQKSLRLVAIGGSFAKGWTSSIDGSTIFELEILAPNVIVSDSAPLEFNHKGRLSSEKSLCFYSSNGNGNKYVVSVNQAGSAVVEINLTSCPS